jgi:hypothetical protein
MRVSGELSAASLEFQPSAQRPQLGALDWTPGLIANSSCSSSIFSTGGLIQENAY